MAEQTIHIKQTAAQVEEAFGKILSGELETIHSETLAAGTKAQESAAAAAVSAAEVAKAEAQELSRKAAEEGREAAETGRADAEVLRVKAEQAREAAETARGTAYTKTEGQRDQAAVAAEGKRDQAAVAAEGRRDATFGEAEARRDQAESQRAAAETARVTAEGLRVKAEQSRETAEGLRATAETARAAAEGRREDLETGYVAAAKAEADRAEAAAQALAVPINDASVAPNTTWSSQKSSNTFANALKGHASGAVVAVDDVSPVEHDVECKVERKNLVRWNPGVTGGEGVTFTLNDDGSIYAKGTAVSQSFLVFMNLNDEYAFEPGVYTASGMSDKVLMGINATDGTTVGRDPVTVQLNEIQTNLVVKVKPGITVDEVVWPKIERGSVATSYSPQVSDLSAVTVSQFGKNVFDMDDLYEGIRANAPDLVEKATYNGKPVIKIHAKAFHERPIIPIPSAPGNRLTMSCMTVNADPSGAYPRNALCTFAYKDEPVSYPWLELGGNVEKRVSITSEPGKEITGIGGTYATGSGSVYVWDFQIEVGTAMTDYNPKQGATFKPDAEGVVSGMKSISPAMTILTDNPGVAIDCTYNQDPNIVVGKLMDRIATLENSATSKL